MGLVVDRIDHGQTLVDVGDAVDEDVGGVGLGAGFAGEAVTVDLVDPVIPIPGGR